jgi:hypothetical protein
MKNTITYPDTQFKLFDNVILCEDIPDYPLKKGSIGTIVEFLKPGVYEVDFSDNQGQTYAMCSVHEHQLIAVPDSVIEFLETIEDDEFTLEDLQVGSSSSSDTLVLQIKVPRKVLKWLTEVAKFRESSSVESLARSYVGEGLRADLDRLGIDRLLAETEQVLSEQIDSQEKVKSMMKTIQERYQQWRIPRS